MEADEVGNVISRSVYEPFGKRLGGEKKGIGYTGHLQDTELGLTYMQARYYDPLIGRFYSNDPVGFTGEVDTFNRYSYVANNPYKYVDPPGEVKINISLNAQFAAGIGWQAGGTLSIDTTYGEISLTGTGGVRAGATAGVGGGITVTDSVKMGNQASLTGSVNADIGLVAVTGKADLVAGQVSTAHDGVKNVSNGGKMDAAVGLKKGVQVSTKVGVSAGVDVTGSATLSIPDTINNAANAVQSGREALDKAISSCSGDPGKC
ncbi:RHS repeat-associated core domain-containing protein [Shewanella sp.]|nr:RHS repeat-associated core domain-containing protein [Shewanella sp.]